MTKLAITKNSTVQSMLTPMLGGAFHNGERAARAGLHLGFEGIALHVFGQAA